MSNVSGQRETERVIVYIDGFNLYYGLRSMGWRHYLWLDLRQLSENLLRPPQRLEIVVCLVSLGETVTDPLFHRPNLS